MSSSTHTSTTTGGQDKLAALHEQISDGVAALVESSPMGGGRCWTLPRSSTVTAWATCC